MLGDALALLAHSVLVAVPALATLDQVGPESFFAKVSQLGLDGGRRVVGDL